MRPVSSSDDGQLHALTGTILVVRVDVSAKGTADTSRTTLRASILYTALTYRASIVSANLLLRQPSAPGRHLIICPLPLSRTVCCCSAPEVSRHSYSHAASTAHHFLHP
jgi:hypothetical protein